MIKVIRIKGCKTCKEVMLHVDRDEDGNDYIKIVAWHYSADGPLIQIGSIQTGDIQDHDYLNAIINDYSDLTANDFANSYQL